MQLGEDIFGKVGEEKWGFQKKASKPKWKEIMVILWTPCRYEMGQVMIAQAEDEQVLVI